jgi:hypothetical protein
MAIRLRTGKWVGHLLLSSDFLEQLLMIPGTSSLQVRGIREYVNTAMLGFHRRFHLPLVDTSRDYSAVYGVTGHRLRLLGGSVVVALEYDPDYVITSSSERHKT